jgi:DNA-binding PadR family transcriptional regulator
MGPREIDRSLIRLYILIEAAKQPLDSVGVAASLRDRGFTLSLASALHILRLFEGKGYLTGTEVRDSRLHKMYTLTAAGRRRTRDAKRKIREMMETFTELGK